MKGGRIMTGEKLKQVRSIRKWLEKAEKSYTRDQDISGELNLIMAQAEMQRLKEKDTAGRRRRVWGVRALAFTAAAGIFFSVSFMRDMMGEEKSILPPAPPVAASVPHQEAAEPVSSRAGEAVPEAPSLVIENEAARPAEESQTAETRPAEKAPPAEKGYQERTPAPSPVLSPKEIQSVVGEAGRALRGQS